MRPTWEFEPLGQLCKTGAGGTPLKSVKEYYVNGDVPWLLSGEVHQGEIYQAKNFITQLGLENSSAKLFPPNTLLIAMYGATAGAVGILRFQASTNQAICGVLPSEKFIPKFLYYYFTHKKDALVAQAAGNAQPNISQEKIKNTCVPVATLDEQRRIVALLDETFADIATAKANAEKSHQNADDLFASAVAAIFAAQDDSWDEKTISQWISNGLIAKPQDGNHGEIHPTKADYVPTGVPFIMAADLMNGQVDTQNCRFISKIQSDNLRIGFAKSGDVLLSHKGTIGRVAILSTDLDYVMLTPQVTYYRSLDASRLSTDFLYFCLLNPKFQSTVNEIAGAGSTRAYIGITRQMDLKLAIPPLSQQIELSTKLKAIEAETKKVSAIYRQKLAALEELKKSLLNQAFSGQI